MSGEVLLVGHDGPVTVLTLNRPLTRNALDAALLSALAGGLSRAAADAEARAVVITGAGGAFCAGADLKAAMMGGDLAPSGGGSPRADGAEAPEGGLSAVIDVYHSLIRAIVGAPKPVIAAVDGAPRAPWS